MAFGSGVLLSAVPFELVAEAEERGGLVPAAITAPAGGAILAVSTRRHRRSRGRDWGS